MTEHADVTQPQPRQHGDTPKATGARRVNRIIDNILSVVLFMTQIGLCGLAFLSFMTFPFTTDNCAYETCGDEKWINHAMLTVALSAPAGAIFSGVGIYLLAKRKVGFWAPLLGAAVQFAIIAAAWIMARNAGPIH